MASCATSVHPRNQTLPAIHAKPQQPGSRFSAGLPSDISLLTSDMLARNKLIVAKSKDVAILEFGQVGLLLLGCCLPVHRVMQGIVYQQQSRDERHCSRDMKSFGWSELHSVKAPGSKLAGIEDDVKREIVDLMISRQGAARDKMQPLFAYHLNPALHDPRGEVVKTNILVFL